MVRTGVLSLSNFCTTGGVASSGSRRPRPLMRSRTSCAADSRSRSSLKVAITSDVPCPETERNSLMPSTVFTTSSTCCVTNDSVSSGAAPGKPMRTETVGRSTEGKRSTPSLKKPAAPTTTSDNTIIDAKTGRRIQISANFCMLNWTDDYSTTSTACPDWRLPGSTTTFSPTLIPATISVNSLPRRPVVIGRSRALPF